MNQDINNLPQLNIDDIKKALGNTTVYMFKYFNIELGKAYII